MMLLGFAGLGFAFRQTRRKVSFAQVTGHTKVRRDRRSCGLFFSDSHGRSAVNISSIANGALGESRRRHRGHGPRLAHAAEPSEAADVGIVERDGMLRLI